MKIDIIESSEEEDKPPTTERDKNMEFIFGPKPIL